MWPWSSPSEPDPPPPPPRRSRRKSRPPSPSSSPTWRAFGDEAGVWRDLPARRMRRPLRKLDDGQSESTAELRKKRIAEEEAAAAATGRPKWDNTTWAYVPAALKGINPVTPEPWARDTEVYNAGMSPRGEGSSSSAATGGPPKHASTIEAGMRAYRAETLASPPPKEAERFVPPGQGGVPGMGMASRTRGGGGEEGAPSSSSVIGAPGTANVILPPSQRGKSPGAAKEGTLRCQQEALTRSRPEPDTGVQVAVLHLDEAARAAEAQAKGAPAAADGR